MTGARAREGDEQNDEPYDLGGDQQAVVPEKPEPDCVGIAPPERLAITEGSAGFRRGESGCTASTSRLHLQVHLKRSDFASWREWSARMDALPMARWMPGRERSTMLSGVEEGAPGRRYRAEDLEGHRWTFIDR